MVQGQSELVRRAVEVTDVAHRCEENGEPELVLGACEDVVRGAHPVEEGPFLGNRRKLRLRKKHQKRKHDVSGSEIGNFLKRDCERA